MRQTVLSLNSLVLLCLYGDFIEDSSYPSFTANQWLRLEFKLAHSTLKQASGLLRTSKEEMMIQLALNESDADRIIGRLKLMDRVLKQLSVYEQQGIGVITKYESDYPDTFCQRLKKNAPLILYYSGNYGLLLQDSISLAGPVHPNQQILNNTRRIVEKIANEGYHLMTSGHTGCEYEGMMHQLKSGGHIILFVADHLLKYRMENAKQIRNQRMLLVSHRRPDSEHDIVESVVRNSYIYALCTTNFIVHSELNTGALWFSALQNLKHRWSKILAVVDDEFYGNARLVEAGAIPVTMEKILSDCTIEEMTEVSKQDIGLKQENEQLSIFEFIEETEEELTLEQI